MAVRKASFSGIARSCRQGNEPRAAGLLVQERRHGGLRGGGVLHHDGVEPGAQRGLEREAVFLRRVETVRERAEHGAFRQAERAVQERLRAGGERVARRLRVVEQVELGLLRSCLGLHLPEIRAQVLQFGRERRLALLGRLACGGGILLGRARRVQARLHLGQRLRRRCGRRLQLLDLARQPLALHQHLARLRLQAGDLVAHLRRVPVAGHGFAPPLLQRPAKLVHLRGRLAERLLRLLERHLGGLEPVLEQGGLLREGFGLHPDLLELLARLVDLAPVAIAPGLVLGDALFVDADHLAGARVGAFRARSLRLERGEAFLERVHVRVDLLGRALGGVHGRRRVGDGLFRVALVLRVHLEREVERLDLALRDVDVQPAQLVAQLLVALRLAHLALERADLPLHLAQHVCLAQEVLLRLVDLAQGLLAVCLELGDAGGLLEHAAPVLGLGREDRVDLALRHHGIGRGSDARAHEEALDVLQAALHLVDEVLALAGAVDAPRHRHLVVLRAELLLAVGERDGDLGEAEGLARVGAVEHHVHELRAANRRRALLAEDPADGIGHVRLAAAVRPDDGDHARLERQARAVGEGLETDDV